MYYERRDNLKYNKENFTQFFCYFNKLRFIISRMFNTKFIILNFILRCICIMLYNFLHDH